MIRRINRYNKKFWDPIIKAED